MSVSSHSRAEVTLGEIAEEWGIRSSLAPFRKVSASVAYPQVVVDALADLYVEYCQAMAFLPVTEWEADYQFCDPSAFAVQIDMVGLDDELLDRLADMSARDVKEVLRGLVFEIDSSIAMYPLLERLFAPSRGTSSEFQMGWRLVLKDLRNRTGKPLALLAVTDEKYAAMMASEFGLDASSELSSSEVKRVTGFDAFFGPSEFRRHVEENGGCQYLLFVRASDPVDKLRRPDTVVDHPILGDEKLRREVRANTITMNVDDPATPAEVMVNDTKAYMPAMGLGYVITSWEDLSGSDFEAFLSRRGISPQDVQAGAVTLRAKPLAASYGGYGHVRGVVTDKRFRTEVRGGLRKRGPYVVQPELTVPMVEDPTTGTVAGYIDRLFIGWADGRPFPIGGFRNYMPTGAGELEAGRIHGNGQAFWGEIRLR